MMMKSEANHMSLNQAINGIMTSKVEQGIDPRVTLLCRTPPPPSSQRRSRGGKGPSTPSGRSLKHSNDSDDDDNDNQQSSPSSSKRKRDSYIGAKWSAWEDKIMLKAVFERSEKGGIWNDVTNEINQRRRIEQEEPRTVKSVTCHWVNLKSKLMGQFQD